MMRHQQQIPAQTGISVGALIAALLSYEHNHSVAWAILHAFCGWFYVLYTVLK